VEEAGRGRGGRDAVTRRRQKLPAAAKVPGASRIAAGDVGGTPVQRGQWRQRRRGVAGREGVLCRRNPVSPALDGDGADGGGGGRGWVAATDSCRAVRKAGRKGNESVRWRGALIFLFGRGGAHTPAAPPRVDATRGSSPSRARFRRDGYGCGVNTCHGFGPMTLSHPSNPHVFVRPIKPHTSLPQRHGYAVFREQKQNSPRCMAKELQNLLHRFTKDF
jgi:hypothetical protein